MQVVVVMVMVAKVVMVEVVKVVESEAERVDLEEDNNLRGMTN